MASTRFCLFELLVVFLPIFTLLYTEAFSFDKISNPINKVGSVFESWSEDPWTWSPLLEDQYYKTIEYFHSLEKDLYESHILSRRRRDNNERISIDVISLSSNAIDYNINSSISTFEVYGHKQILVEDGILLLHQHEDANIYLEYAYIISGILDEATFVEVAEYQNRTLVLIVFNVPYCQLYLLPDSKHSIDTSGWNQNILQQTIASKNDEIKAAKFLQNDGELYLVIIYNNRRGKTDSIIYKWSGSHMDELYTMESDRAVDLAIIKRREDFYIIIAENPRDKQVESSSVWIFQPNSGVRRLHSIPSQRASLILAYEDSSADQFPHVLLVNKNSHSDIYRLTRGGEFVPANKIFDFRNISTGLTAAIDGISFIFLATKNDISIYIPAKDDLKKLYGFEITNSNKIISIDHVKIINGSNALIIISKSAKTIDLTVLYFNVERDLIVSAPQTDPMVQCMVDIETLLNKHQNTIDELQSRIQKIVTKDSAVINGVLKVSKDVNIVNSKIDRVDIACEDGQEPLIANTEMLLEAAAVADEGINLLDLGVSKVFVKNEPMVITNFIEVKGDLIVENAKAKELSIATVNDKPFSTNSFIFNTDAQNIPEYLVDGKKIVTNNLTAPHFNTYLQNAATFDSLTAKNVIIDKRKTINGIDPERFVRKGFEGTIMGTKTFDRVEARSLFAERLDKEPLTPWIQRALNNQVPIKNLRSESNVTVTQLFVKTINGINVTDMMDTSFLKGIHNEISGSLKFLQNLTVKSLQCNTLQGKKVNEFMTKTTEQTIDSKIKFRNILVRNLNVEKVNGVDLANDVALIGKHNTINAPTTLFTLDIVEDLFLNCGSGNQSFCNLVEMKQDDLLQIYNGTVTIQGSVSVQDLKFNQRATLKVADEDFHTDVESLFWLKGKSQIIPNDAVFTKGVSVPQISAEMVNGQLVDGLFSTIRDGRNVSALFKDVDVKRDITSSGVSECSLVREINKSAVKKTGTFIVTGKKSFVDSLVVGNLKTQFMNDLNMEDVVLKTNDKTKFKGELRMKTARIQGDLLVNSNINVEELNSLNVAELADAAAKVNTPATLHHVIFNKNVQADRVTVETGSLAGLSDVLNTALSGVKIHAAAGAYLNEVEGVNLINGLKFNKYMERVVCRHGDDIEVRGEKTFKGGVTVSNEFSSSNVNDIPFEIMFYKALTRSTDQEISGEHSVENIYTDALYTEEINGVKSDDLIDVTRDAIKIQSDVSFESLRVTDGDAAAGKLPCDLQGAAETLSRGKLPARPWSQVKIDGMVSWEHSGSVTRILDKAVLKNQDAVIEAEVIFEENLTTKEVDSIKYINNIDVEHIAKDSLKKFSEEPQIITGSKIIKGELIVGEVEAVELQSELVNGYHILGINNSLVRKDGDCEILGDKVIKGNMAIENLKTESLIHGILVHDLVTVGDDRPIDSAHFHSLSIESDLDVEEVNDIHLRGMLKNAIRLSGPEQHIYDDVTFEAVNIGDCQLESINSIPMKSMVIDTEGEKFTITGDITFTQDVIIEGPAKIGNINEFNVENAYKSTVFGTDDSDLYGDVIFEAPLTVLGDISSQGKINGIEIREAMQHSTRALDESIEKSNSVTNRIQQSIEAFGHDIKTMSTAFVYADVWNQVNVSIYDCIPAVTKSFEAEAHVEVHDKTPGYFCGLQPYCTCSRHHMIKILKDGTWFIFPGSDNMRIYHLLTPPGFYTDFMTTTMYSENQCRPEFEHDAFEERSWFSWKSDSGDDGISNIRHEIPGFVSDVKSFFSNGKYYIVVGQLYHPQSDSNNLDTVIMILDFNQHTSTVTQRIPSFGTKALEILETKRGIHLVIGNSYDSIRQVKVVDSYIFRYNGNTGTFDFLQSVTTDGCHLICSAVVQDDHSFIMLAQRGFAPLLIMTYDGLIDKYTTYQSFAYGAVVKAISVTYPNYKKMADPLLFVATSQQLLYIYQYTFSAGWKIHSTGKMAGIQCMIPFSIATNQYVFIPSTNTSSTLSLLTQGIV